MRKVCKTKSEKKIFLNWENWTFPFSCHDCFHWRKARPLPWVSWRCWGTLLDWVPLGEMVWELREKRGGATVKLPLIQILRPWSCSGRQSCPTWRSWRGRWCWGCSCTPSPSRVRRPRPRTGRPEHWRPRLLWLEWDVWPTQQSLDWNVIGTEHDAHLLYTTSKMIQNSLRILDITVIKQLAANR